MVTFKFIHRDGEALEVFERRWDKAILELQSRGLTIGQDDPDYSVSIDSGAQIDIWETVPLESRHLRPLLP